MKAPILRQLSEMEGESMHSADDFLCLDFDSSEMPFSADYLFSSTGFVKSGDSSSGRLGQHDGRSRTISENSDLSFVTHYSEDTRQNSDVDCLPVAPGYPRRGGTVRGRTVTTLSLDHAQSLVSSMTNLHPQCQSLDALNRTWHGSGRPRSHSHITPIQSDSNITPIQSDSNITPIQSDSNITPIQSDYSNITPMQSDYSNTTPRDSRTTKEEATSATDTTYASLDIGPTVQLPPNSSNKTRSLSSPLEDASGALNTTLPVEKSIILKKTSSEGTPPRPEITKHSFNFQHRRSINLYSSLKSINGSRSLSDILTASERSSNSFRYRRRASPIPFSREAARMASLADVNSSSTTEEQPTTVIEKKMGVFQLSDTDDSFDDTRNSRPEMLSRIAERYGSSENKSTSSIRRKLSNRLRRSDRTKRTSASMDDFLSTRADSESFLHKEEVKYRLDSSPCRLENTFQFGGSCRPSQTASIKPIQRQQAVEISKSLDSCLSETNWQTSLGGSPSSPVLDDSEGDSVDGLRSSKSNKRPSGPILLSPPSLISEINPGENSCSNKIIHKLARRLSLKRKRSKEKKNAKEPLRRVSSPYYSSEDTDQRKSVDGSVHRTSSHGQESITTDSDRSSSHELQNEALYRGIVRCLLHPLGSTDSTIGLRPGDLLDHIRMVFDVSQSDHELFIRDELQNKPTKVEASLTIVEAKDLTLGDKIDADTAAVCCFLTLAQPSKHSSSLSPKQSPRASPKTSPKSSPKFRRTPPRSPSIDGCDVIKTHSCKSSRDPKWNECFHFDLDDLTADEIRICLCHHQDDVLSDSLKQPEKVKAVKGFLRYLWQGSNDHHDHTKSMPGAFGRVILPVKDIPVEGCDKWFDIYPINSWNRSKPVGQIRLQVAVSSRHSDSQAGFFSAEDYHLASLLVHKHAASDVMDADGVDLNLSLQSRRILNIFAVSNGISKLSQKILDLTVALELVCTRFSQNVTDSVLHRAMEEVQMTWWAMQTGAGDYLQRMPLCDAEICLYRSATRRYIEAIIAGLPSKPCLFPPSCESIHNLKYQFGISLHLLELDLWESSNTPQRDLASAVINKLQVDVRSWIEANLDTIHVHSNVKDSVIPEIEALVNVTNSLINICVPLGIVDQFYSGFGVKYYRIVSFEMERRFSATVRELMMNLDKYQKRYHNFKSNLDSSCRLSLKLYFAVGSFYETIKENISERDLFRLSIPLYQDWFEEAVVFWLQMFRSECTSRIQKALEIDKDFVLVTSLLKYSNSSVDAQTCFTEIANEWRKIDIKDADTAVMGVTKITDMICDGARLYASNIQHILKRNCYYDCNEGQFDVTDRMCITLNNIEHVRTYLSELPERLDMERVVDTLSMKHEDEEVGKKAFATLRRLINTAQSDILHQSAHLLWSICDKMSVEIQRNMDRFLVKSPEKPMATDKLIGYLNTNLEVLNERLSETIFPHTASHMWITVIQLFDKNVPDGKAPDYYDHLKKHLRALTSFFHSWYQSEGNLSLDTMLLENLKSRLDINSWKTEELMREYFHDLASQMTTPVDYLGHLAVKVAYMEETRGNITIYVKVIQGIDLPGLDTSGLSDPYVVVTLQPDPIFGQAHQKTRTIDQTLQPVFNSTFQFHNICKECLTERGNCILLSVMDKDVVKTDDFAGEVLIAMDTIRPIGMNETIDNATAVMMPLKRPQHETGGPFQILGERSSWDKAAKNFLKDRKRFIENQKEPTDTIKDKLSSFFKLWTWTGHKDEAG